MTTSTLKDEIAEAVPKLLQLARSVTRNKISDNCRFILTAIKDSREDFHQQRILLKKENDKKVPVLLEDLLPTMESLYPDLYDINLYIYRSSATLTVVDIRYYSKHLLDADYRQTVIHRPPMLHCKVSIPPWLQAQNKKFDINWQHQALRNKLKLFLLKLRLSAFR